VIKSVVFASALAGLAAWTVGDRWSPAAGQNDVGIVAQAYDSAALSDQDRDFMNNAALGGMFEVRESKAAAEKTTTDGIKQFANQMIDDHTAVNKELAKLASDKMVTIPTDLEKSQQKQIDDLNQLSGADFDKQYIKDQLDAHKDAVKLFQTEINEGQETDVKQFAAHTLPTLQHHLAMVEALDSGTTVGMGN
jgi:putative membrane protein